MVNLNLDNVFKWTLFFLRLPLRNSRCCRAIIAIFMISSNAKHYWKTSRHPILMNCWRFYLQWVIITVIWMIELEFWDFVTFTHCSIQIFSLYLFLLEDSGFGPVWWVWKVSVVGGASNLILSLDKVQILESETKKSW